MLAGLTVVVGIAIVAFVSAATVLATLEPESGTIASPAQAVTLSGTSGGKALKFGAATPTPTPTPSPTPGGRPFPFPATLKPDATNTGLLPNSTLTVVSTDQTYGSSFNGQTISNKEFRGWVTVTGANITFSNCLFRGRDPQGANHALFDTEGSTGTITVQDSEFSPAVPAPTVDDMAARNTTLYRVNVHGGVDGMKAQSNTLVQDSYFHDMTWFPSDPNQGGGATHNDAVQTFDNETNITLRHNNLDMSTTQNANAAWQSSGFNSRAENNWIDGGGCSINFAAQPLNGGTLQPMYVVNNRFGRHQFFTGCVVLISNKTVLTQYTGNVWDDTGQPVPSYQQHD